MANAELLAKCSVTRRAPWVLPLSMTPNAAFKRDLLHVLRNLHRRDVLAESPLVAASFVRAYAHANDSSVAVILRDAIVASIRELAVDPIDRPAAILLESAFVVVPRRKQLAIASDLGMGFSTYRRHLAAAIDALVDALAVPAERESREPSGAPMDNAFEPWATRTTHLPKTRRGSRYGHMRSRSPSS